MKYTISRPTVMRLRSSIKRWSKRLAPSALRLNLGQRRRVGLPLSQKHKKELVGILLLVLLGLGIGVLLRSQHIHHFSSRESRVEPRVHRLEWGY